MQNFDRQLRDIYSKSLVEKRAWYSRVAATYDRARPRYPDRLISRAVSVAGLSERSHVLEIGCGPGISTLPFARVGCSMTCLEPSAAACEIARKHCQCFPNVAIVNSTFEEWNAAPECFDAAIAATSWHWVGGIDKFRKVWSTLKPNGTFILLWNTPPEPSREVHAQLQDIYNLHAPHLADFAGIERHIGHIAKLGIEVKDSGWFEAVESEQIEILETILGDRYIELLQTLSPYMALPEKTRVPLFAELRQRLKVRFADSVKTERLSASQIFVKQVKT